MHIKRKKTLTICILLATAAGFLYAQIPGTTPFAFLKKPVPASCDGTLVGGYCWYLAAGDSTSCDTVCSSRGGCNISGTRDYAGSGGTDANCQAVMTALGASGSWDSSVGQEFGCFIWSSNLRRGTWTTTCADQNNNIVRACACNN